MMENKMKKSYIYINKTGYFGDFLFEELLGNDPNRWNNEGMSEEITEEINLNKLQEDKSKSYYLKYPSFDELLKNIDILKEYGIVFLLRKDQEKEINFLEQYYPVKKMNWSQSHLEYFSGISMPESHEEKIKFAKRNIKGKILMILDYAQNELELNPSYLLNIKSKLSKFFALDDFFKKSDFKNLNKEKFPLTNELINKNENSEIIANQLFYELIKENNPLNNIMEKIKKLEHQYDDKCIPLEKFTDEEKLCLNILKRKGDIYEPNPNQFKRL